jgi:hypothetical protein
MRTHHPLSPENHIEPRRVPSAARCELDTSFCSNDSLGRPHLHSPSLACRVFLIKKPYSSKRAAQFRVYLKPKNSKPASPIR